MIGKLLCRLGLHAWDYQFRYMGEGLGLVYTRLCKRPGCDLLDYDCMTVGKPKLKPCHPCSVWIRYGIWND